jgi:hypothetical protein
VPFFQKDANLQGVDGRSQMGSGLPRHVPASAHDWGQVLTFQGKSGSVFTSFTTIYTWLTHPVLDPTHLGRVTMDNLMKLVTTVLEWTYQAGETNVRAERLKSAAELLVLRHDTLRIIDGAGPDAPVEDQDAETKDRANGKEPELQTVQENEQQNTTKTVETAEEPVQTSASPKCTFSRTVVAIDLKRFTASSVTSVECPDCGRTRSLSPVKGVLRFPPHDRRKMQTSVTGKRWSAQGKTDWDVVGG